MPPTCIWTPLPGPEPYRCRRGPASAAARRHLHGTATPVRPVRAPAAGLSRPGRGTSTIRKSTASKAQLALRDGCVRLQACGIPVFWAHGNHDPLDSRLKTVDWPDNVTIFGPEPEQHVLYRDGAPLAVIHGISHARIREARNLAPPLPPPAGDGLLPAGRAALQRGRQPHAGQVRPPARWTICVPPVWMPGLWAMCTNAAPWRAIPSSPIPAIPRDSTSMKAARAAACWSLPRPATVLSPAGKSSCRWGRYNGSVRSSVWTPWNSSTP